MPDILYTFSRIEQKYLLTEETAAALLAAFSDDLCPDEWGESRIYSLYFDTANDRLIRDSLSGAPFKEKLRLRAYGKIPETNDRVYLEIKRKYEGWSPNAARASRPARQRISFGTGKCPPTHSCSGKWIISGACTARFLPPCSFPAGARPFLPGTPPRSASPLTGK